MLKAIIKKIINFRDYKIRTKLILVVSVFFILSASISIFSLLCIRNIKDANATKSLIGTIDKHALNIIYIEKEYLDTLSDYHLSQYTMNINNLTVAFEELKKSYSDEADIGFILQLIDSHMQSFFATSDSVKESINKGYGEKTLAKIISGAKLDLSQQHDEFYTTLMRFCKKVNNIIDDSVRATENKIKLSFLFLGVAIIVVTLLVLRGVNVLIVSPIRNLMSGIAKFGKGKLDSRIELKTRDEIGELADSFNQMAGNLQETTVSRDTLAQEVSERKKVEEALRKSEERFKQVVENAQEWIWEVNANGLYTYASPIVEEIFGYKPEEIVGKKYFYDLFYPEDREELKRAAFEVFAKKESFRGFINRNVHKNGKIVWLSTGGVPILDEKGNLLRYRGADTDITERKKAEEELKKAMNIKSKFTSMVSHELRTPLTSIKEGIGIVLDGSAGELNEEQKDFLDTAKRNVDRLHRLINDILDFAKLEAGRVEFRMQENDINETIKEAVKTQKTVAEGKGLYLKTELNSRLGKIRFDSDRIIRVLTNLINNAIKFTKEGGITVKSAREEEERVIRISVKDTGEGIREEDLQKVFQDFQQVGASKYRRSGGTGLGLAICREIVEGHGGRIWAESKYGAGSKFIFTLPLERKGKARPKKLGEILLKTGAVTKEQLEEALGEQKKGSKKLLEET